MRRYIFLLIAIGLLLIQTLPTIIGGRFTFAFDMGRDLLWVRNIVELKKPTLIGPWGSIAGVYFGPLWYYLLAIPYSLFHGSPRSAVLVPLTANTFTILLGWWYLKRRRHPIAANVFALFYSTSPLIVSLSSFAFHANLLPLATLLFTIGLINFDRLVSLSSANSRSRFFAKRDKFTNHFSLLLTFPLSALSASLAYHLEPAAGVMLTLFLGVWIIGKILKHRRGPLQCFETLKLLAISAILFLIPFIPQIVFELRHDFVETKALVSYFKGENTSLGGVLPLSKRLVERIDKISGSLSYSLFPVSEIWQKWLILAIFLILIVIVVKKCGSGRFIRSLLLVTCCLLLFHYLAYVFLFPAELKGWYLSGFVAILILAAALIMEQIFIRRRITGGCIAAALILWNTKGLTKFIPDNRQPAAPETLTAQLEIVDWIYQDALKTTAPFSIYTYTPPVYDYNYQYLIWWRGTARYGILPAEFSYWPEEISYLPEKEKFVSSDWKPEDAKTAYLILEPDTVEFRRQGWLGHFAGWPGINKINFPSGVKVQIRAINPIKL